MTKIEIKAPPLSELTEGGFSKYIEINHKQSKQSLIEYGFTNCSKGTLYFMRMLNNDISFNLSVDENTLEITRIDVLDEDFLQPYDYQIMLMDNPEFKPAIKIYHKVNEIFARLQEDGIITGFKKGMYI